MSADGGGGGRGAASLVIVSADGRVEESQDSRLRPGDSIGESAWWGGAALQAVGVARKLGHGQAVARDAASGARWLIDVSTVGDSPWRARVMAIDAMPAVDADRRAVFGKLVHSLQNVSFGLLSVLEALELERPSGTDLDEYITHLKDPAERLSATMKHLHGCIVPPVLDKQSVRVSSLLDLAVSRVAKASRPAVIDVLCPAEATVAVDVERMSEVVIAMLESGPRQGPTHLVASLAEASGARRACVSVERSASPLERDTASVWDLGGENRAELPLRLAFASAVVQAHDGAVRAVFVPPGRIRLEVHLPQVSDG